MEVESFLHQCLISLINHQRFCSGSGIFKLALNNPLIHQFPATEMECHLTLDVQFSIYKRAYNKSRTPSIASPFLTASVTCGPSRKVECPLTPGFLLDQSPKGRLKKWNPLSHQYILTLSVNKRA